MRRPDVEAALVGVITAVAVVTFLFTTLVIVFGGGIGD